MKSREPWEGRSPRGLTRGSNILIFKTQGAKKRERSSFGEQLELWPELAGRGPLYEGAPLLLPLPEEGESHG